jgi:hypothetical protein
MLASTVQFSNNDQPPITPRLTSGVHWGRRLRKNPFPQTPNSVPDTISRPDQRSTPSRAVLAPDPS